MKGKLTKQRTTAGHEFRARNRMWDNVLTCVHCGQAYGSEDTICSMNPEVADLHEQQFNTEIMSERMPDGANRVLTEYKRDYLREAPSGHQWDDDRCELCGDKDWRADRFCSGNPGVRHYRERWLERQRQQAPSPAGEKESNKKG